MKTYRFFGFEWTGPQLILLGMSLLTFGVAALAFAVSVDVFCTVYPNYLPPTH